LQLCPCLTLPSPPVEFLSYSMDSLSASYRMLRVSTDCLAKWWARWLRWSQAGCALCLEAGAELSALGELLTLSRVYCVYPFDGSRVQTCLIEARGAGRVVASLVSIYLFILFHFYSSVHFFAFHVTAIVPPPPPPPLPVQKMCDALGGAI
jgi:hypothetical protein